MDDRVHGKLAQCLETWAGQTAGDPQFNALKRAYDIIINGNALQGGRRQQQTLQSVVPREPPKVSKNYAVENREISYCFSQEMSRQISNLQKIVHNCFHKLYPLLILLQKIFQRMN